MSSKQVTPQELDEWLRSTLVVDRNDSVRVEGTSSIFSRDPPSLIESYDVRFYRQAACEVRKPGLSDCSTRPVFLNRRIPVSLTARDLRFPRCDATAAIKPSPCPKLRAVISPNIDKTLAYYVPPPTRQTPSAAGMNFLNKRKFIPRHNSPNVCAIQSSSVKAAMERSQGSHDYLLHCMDIDMGGRKVDDSYADDISSIRRHRTDLGRSVMLMMMRETSSSRRILLDEMRHLGTSSEPTNEYHDHDMTIENTYDRTSTSGNHAHEIDEAVEWHGTLDQDDDEMESAIQVELQRLSAIQAELQRMSANLQRHMER